MFTIDLLKGQGRPVRTRPQGIAIFVATFAFPVLAAFLVVGFYFNNKVIIAVHQQNITNYTTQLDRLSDALKLKESWEKDKTSINNCLADVANSINRHTQWTPVLVSLVECLPESVVINSVEVKQASVKRKAAVKSAADKEKKETKKADASVAVRTLKLKVCGNSNSDFEREVKVFRDRLRASKVIGPKLEDIVIASQGNDTLDGREVVSYDIDCIFKPGV
jgi:hypothetical protein